MSDRYKSRGRKERTPEQLKVLEMAREKARLVIAERTKIKREMADPPPTVSPPPEPEPVEAEPQPPTPQEIPEPEPEPEPKPPEPREQEVPQREQGLLKEVPSGQEQAQGLPKEDPLGQE